jgi:hypothetical protein
MAAARRVAARDVEIEAAIRIEVDELRAVIAEIERAVFRQHVRESLRAVVAEERIHRFLRIDGTDVRHHRQIETADADENFRHSRS